MTAGERIEGFRNLGSELRMILDKKPATVSGNKLVDLLSVVHVGNAWFTEENVRFRLEGISESLEAPVLQEWLSRYTLPGQFSEKTIGVIVAGNIPLAGFDDFIHVLICGHAYCGKLSSDDNKLLPLIAGILEEIEPRFQSRITFTSGRLGKIDSVIATGSNNSSRYFEYYFAKYPYVIRKNRNSVAVFSGNETKEQLAAFGEDLFRYFGLGCRNVTKVFVPAGYKFDGLFEALFPWGDTLMLNRKYMNNYEYNRTIYMLNSEPLLDNNFLVIKQDAGIASPPGVLYFETYEKIDEVTLRLAADRERIQCVVSQETIAGAYPLGTAQKPNPWDYADGIDTIEFLLKQ
ncbi:MAG TPA: acyl-CoA reductase [Bacteroidia bacterium]|nr:acyl-CoA reductase [Bacteroidia bacterium]